jgi:hypothetical protein
LGAVKVDSQQIQNVRTYSSINILASVPRKIKQTLARARLRHQKFKVKINVSGRRADGHL